MADKGLWEKVYSEDEEVQEGLKKGLKKRSLNSISPLKSYLFPGAKVLDVGSGPGTITVEVATEVHPGSVVGFDGDQLAVDQAKELAEKNQIKNVTFQVGDAYSLEFEDKTFDVAYSHALLEYLNEPVRALKEQQRVTKRGGWVIAAGLGPGALYPPCPALEKYNEARSHLNDPSDPENFMNFDRGRESMAEFSLAGFGEIKIEGFNCNCEYQGSENFDKSMNVKKILLDLEGPYGLRLRKLIEKGVLDEETIVAARKEIDEWLTHAHALTIGMKIFAAGKVE